MRVRLFVFGDDGSLRRLPKDLADELAIGRTRLQAFAGRTLRIAEVILKIENGKPVRVVRVSGWFWQFDERGSIQRSLADAGIEGLETHQALQEETATSDGRVVEISARLARKRWQAKSRWEPTPADITRIVNAIWPKSAGQPVEPLQSVKTSWKRRTPVSHEAKRALSRSWDHVLEISHQLEELDDRSLKSVVEKSRENAADTDVVRRALWEGIAQAAERELQRREVWKSSRGRWFAVAQKIVWQRYNQTEGHPDVIEFVECDGKEAAIKVGRDMLKKYADQFDESVTIDVKIHPEIEWRPPDR